MAGKQRRNLGISMLDSRDFQRAAELQYFFYLEQLPQEKDGKPFNKDTFIASLTEECRHNTKRTEEVMHIWSEAKEKGVYLESPLIEEELRHRGPRLGSTGVINKLKVDKQNVGKNPWGAFAFGSPRGQAR